MNDCSVGTGSPLHPPIAITEVPEETSSAAADCEPFVAADHSVCAPASTPARSVLVASSPVQLPVWAAPLFSAVGIEPWWGVAAVAMEKAAAPAAATTTPMTAAGATAR